MATNYERGRAKEYRICQKLREEGFDIVQRSAGSHSPVDIWAVRRSDRKILLVQVKKWDITEAERGKLLEEWKWLTAGGFGEFFGEGEKKFDVEFEVR